MNIAILVGIMSVMTMVTRFLPFVLFRKNTPAYITYLGNILPSAVIAMLVVYCLKDISLNSAPFGVPELLSAVSVVMLQVWKHNSILSILSGTILYMLLVQLVFV